MTTLEDQKSERVLAGATAIFLQYGFTAATTDQIQKASGVSKATVYKRYPTKEALFVAAITRQCELLMNQMNEIVADSDRLKEGLSELGKAYLSILLSSTGLALYRTVVAEALRFPQLGKAFYHAGPEVVLAKTTKIIEQAVAQNKLDVQSIGIRSAATQFLSLLRGEGQMQCLTFPDYLPSDIQITEWVDSALTTFLKAYQVV